jgi:hypothetical protein
MAGLGMMDWFIMIITIVVILGIVVFSHQRR